MNHRRKGREFALQKLYALEIGQIDSGSTDEYICKGLGAVPEAKEYGLSLVASVMENVIDIDKVIESAAKQWSLSRIAVIDKIIMRLCVAEMYYLCNVPAAVGITESVQIASKYSTQDSPKFINGVLDAIVKNRN